MLEKDAIQHIEQGALLKDLNDTTMHEHNILLVPCDTNTVDLEKYLDQPRRFRGCYRTDVIEEFVTYSNAEHAGTVFIEPGTTLGATTMFDLGTSIRPGHGDHTALLKLSPEPEYITLLDADGRRFSQRQFAEWLEEHHANMVALSKEEAIGQDPAEIRFAEAISGVRNLEIKTQAEVSNKIEDTSESSSAFASVDLRGKSGKLPTYLDWTCVPFEGLTFLPIPNGILSESMTFRIRVSVVTDKDGPIFALKILKLSEKQKAIANAFKAQLKTSLECKNIHIGVFTK